MQVDPNDHVLTLSQCIKIYQMKYATCRQVSNTQTRDTLSTTLQRYNTAQPPVGQGQQLLSSHEADPVLDLLGDYCSCTGSRHNYKHHEDNNQNCLSYMIATG